MLAPWRRQSIGDEHQRPIAQLAQWLDNDFVCDRCGRRFVAAWREEAERKASRTPRVRVEARQLAALVSYARSIAHLQGAGRARAVSASTRPVLTAGGHGVLRSNLDLLRGPRSARERRPWPQP